MRAAYGLHAREMLAWLNQLQHARGMNVVFVGILEKSSTTSMSRLGTANGRSKTGRELPGIVDQIITMHGSTSATATPARAFVCTRQTPGAIPQRIEPGRLEQIEKATLGELIDKLITSGQRKPFLVSPQLEASQ